MTPRPGTAWARGGGAELCRAAARPAYSLYRDGGVIRGLAAGEVHAGAVAFGAVPRVSGTNSRVLARGFRSGIVRHRRRRLTVVVMPRVLCVMINVPVTSRSRPGAVNGAACYIRPLL